MIPLLLQLLEDKMRQTDSDFGDSLALEMAKIMSSKEHQDTFYKTAQLFGPEANRRALEHEIGTYDPTRTSPTGPVAGGTMNERVKGPQQSGAGEVDVSMAIPVGPVSEQEQQAALERVRATKKAVEDLASDPLSPAASLLEGGTITELDADLLGIPSEYLIEAGFNVSASKNVLDMIVKIADYLGKEGLTVSEAVADKLLNTIIVESTKKSKICEKCKEMCENCKCEDEKKS